jgi:hypothetical protein
VEDIPKEDAEEGMQIVEDVLRTWTSRTAASQDAMDVDGEGGEFDAEAELAALRSCFEEFKPKTEGNKWVQADASGVLMCWPPSDQCSWCIILNCTIIRSLGYTRGHPMRLDAFERMEWEVCVYSQDGGNFTGRRLRIAQSLE